MEKERWKPDLVMVTICVIRERGDERERKKRKQESTKGRKDFLSSGCDSGLMCACLCVCCAVTGDDDHVLIMMMSMVQVKAQEKYAI